MGPKEREIKRRLRVLEHAEKIGNVRMTCRYFGLARSTCYRWKTEYDKHGEAGLNRKSTAPEVVLPNDGKRELESGRMAEGLRTNFC